MLKINQLGRGNATTLEAIHTVDRRPGRPSENAERISTVWIPLEREALRFGNGIAATSAIRKTTITGDSLLTSMLGRIRTSAIHPSQRKTQHSLPRITVAVLTEFLIDKIIHVIYRT
jgi:hypothetical protein